MSFGLLDHNKMQPRRVYKRLRLMRGRPNKQTRGGAEN